PSGPGPGSGGTFGVTRSPVRSKRTAFYKSGGGRFLYPKTSSSRPGSHEGYSLGHVDHPNYDFKNRWQNPVLVAFVQRDPIGIWGDGINFGNAYGFVGDDPQSKLDPFG